MCSSHVACQHCNWTIFSPAMGGVSLRVETFRYCASFATVRRLTTGGRLKESPLSQQLHLVELEARALRTSHWPMRPLRPPSGDVNRACVRLPRWNCRCAFSIHGGPLG